MLVSTFGAFSQMLPNTNPRPLDPTTCSFGPLNPIAGVEYDYSATIDPALGSAYWFATFDNTTFMSNGILTPDQEAIGGDFVSAAANYQNNATGVTSPTTTSITWNSVGLAQITPANPLFVVLHYTAPATDCADNLKVYRLEPANAFQVNVLNLGGTYSTPVESCISNMLSAEYDLANSCMINDYGIDTLAYEVVAAYFTGGYTPSFRVDGIQVGQDVDVRWSYSNDITTSALAGTLSADGVITLSSPVTTALPSTEDGVSIYVWLVVNHNNYEGLADTPLTFAAAGTNLANQPNVRWDNCTIEVDILAALSAADGPDYGIHTLNPRPTVTGTTGGGFETECP